MRTFSTKILTLKLGVCIICGYICIYVGMLKNTTGVFCVCVCALPKNQFSTCWGVGVIRPTWLLTALSGL